MLQRYSTPLLTITIALLALLIVVMRVVPFPHNDDAYIYYNYARNFVEGRPFAYDVRGIPSEGFTSLLYYLLLLVPFQAVGLDMMFAGIILNILALLLTAAFAGLLAAQISKKHPPALFFISFVALFMFDPYIVKIIGFGLETLLSPVTLFAAAWAIACATHSEVSRRGQYINLFYAVTFLTFLVRPENLLLIGGAGGLVLLLYYPNRREVVIKGVLFALVFAAYHGLKLLIFHDLMPTGFYRKVTMGLDGLEYVRGAIEAYFPWALILVALALIYRLKTGRLSWHPAGVFLLLVSVFTLIFFVQVNPLIGYNYRFLINVTASLFFFISLLAVQLVGQSRRAFALVSLIVLLPLAIDHIPLSEIPTSLISTNE